MTESASSGQAIIAHLHKISEAANDVPDQDLVGFYRGALLGIQDPTVRRTVEALLVSYGRGVAGRLPSPTPPHVVVLVHGIRTEATWQEPLAALLNAIRGVKTKPIRYGFFDVVRFVVPSPLRHGPVKHIEKQLRLIIGENPSARVSVIAHSYGTYAISRVLLENSDIKLHRLILCGSIVPTRFAWDRVASQILKPPILNECGTRDFWPIMANIMTWGFGSSGTFGFQNVFPLNRFHDLGHSDFLKEGFYESKWMPLFENCDAEPVSIAGPRPTSPGHYSFINLMPIRWLLAVGSATGLWLAARQFTMGD